MLQIGEMKMSKAAKFDEFLSSNNINCFSKEEIDNEMHSIVYRPIWKSAVRICQR